MLGISANHGHSYARVVHACEAEHALDELPMQHLQRQRLCVFLLNTQPDQLEQSCLQRSVTTSEELQSVLALNVVDKP